MQINDSQLFLAQGELVNQLFYQEPRVGLAGATKERPAWVAVLTATDGNFLGALAMLLGILLQLLAARTAVCLHQNIAQGQIAGVGRQWLVKIDEVTV